MTPDFRIIADASDVTAHIRGNLASLSITEQDGMEADRIEIAITDPGHRIALPRKGAVLTVAMGWKGHTLVEKGSFTVDEVGEDGPVDTISIVGRAVDFRAATAKNKYDTSYDDTSLGGVLQQIAARNGWTAAVHDSFASIPIPHLDQTNESDVNLVTRLGAKYGALASVKSGRLLFTPKNAGVTAGGSALPAVVINRGDGDRHRFHQTDRDGEQSGVRARWHDWSTGETKEELSGGDGNVDTLRRTYGSQAEAQAAAAAAISDQRSTSASLSLTLAYGRPDLLGGSPLRLVGWRSEITALEWIANQVVHKIEGDGFTTEVSATTKVESGS